MKTALTIALTFTVTVLLSYSLYITKQYNDTVTQNKILQATNASLMGSNDESDLKNDQLTIDMTLLVTEMKAYLEGDVPAEDDDTNSTPNYGLRKL
jgi:hypothetical protein